MKHGPLIVVGFEIRDRERRLVARHLGRHGDLATNDEMRAFLHQHGTLGLERLACPILGPATVTRFPLPPSSP